MVFYAKANLHVRPPTLKKLDKYNPEVQNLFSRQETPRSILFFEDDSMAILYRDFSKDTVSLNWLFETEVPENLSSFPQKSVPCLIFDHNKKPKFFINSNKEKIPLPDDYPSAQADITHANLEQKLDSREIILHSGDLVFEWLKSQKILKGSIKKQGEKRLGGGSTTVGGVKLAQNPVTKEWISVKRMSDADAAKTAELGVLRELGELRGVVAVGNKHYIAAKLHHGVHIDKFHASSDIRDLDNPLVSITQTLRIMLSLASETQKLHDKGILHHDINSGNILVDLHEQCVHFVDFGQSRSVKPGDWRISDENKVITGYLRALALGGPRKYLLEELVKENNKNLFFCLSCFPDADDKFDLLPFIQRLSDALNNKNIQLPKEKMAEPEEFRQKHIQQIAMSAENFHALITARNENNKNVISFKSKDDYISKQSVAKALKSELEEIKANIDIENIPQNLDERNKVQIVRDKYLQEFNLIKNNIAIDSLKTREVTDIFVKYQIVKLCDEGLDKSSHLKSSSTGLNF